MYTREKYLEIIEQVEALGACEGNLKKAKEFFAANNFEALHKIVVWDQDWIREQGVISELLSGTGETWHPNGQLESHGTFVDGNCHGVWEWFHDNGQLWARGAYESGKRHGVWENWHDNGKLSSRGAYVDGDRHGVWEWFDDGLIYERKTYEQGKLIKTEKF